MRIFVKCFGGRRILKSERKWLLLEHSFNCGSMSTGMPAHSVFCRRYAFYLFPNFHYKKFSGRRSERIVLIWSGKFRAQQQDNRKKKERSAVPADCWSRQKMALAFVETLVIFVAWRKKKDFSPGLQDAQARQVVGKNKSHWLEETHVRLLFWCNEGWGGGSRQRDNYTLRQLSSNSGKSVILPGTWRD